MYSSGDPKNGFMLEAVFKVCGISYLDRALTYGEANGGSDIERNCHDCKHMGWRHEAESF